MRVLSGLCLLLAATAAVAASLPSVAFYAGIVNKDVQRMVDLSQHVAEEVVSVTVENTGKATQNDYILAFASSSRLSFIEAASVPATEKDADKDAPPPAGTPLAVVRASVSGLPADPATPTIYYRVTLPSGLAPGNSVTIQLHATYTRVLTPLPATIGQGDAQLVVYEGSPYFYSPYKSSKQLTQFKLAQGEAKPKVEAYDAEEAKLNGADVLYGPYTDLAAFATGAARVHFENNSPFVTLTTAIKEIEVSHYGNVAIEEQYELLHTGAKLNTGFSRFEYQRGQNTGAPSSFRHITALLPDTATEIYYRDQIGNISTSHLRDAMTQDGSRTGQFVFEVEPRFPMFGGWSDDFYFGYNLPLWDYLSTDDNTGDFVLNISFASPFPQAAIDTLEVRVILPEGASDIKFRTPFDVDSASFDVRVTYLDTTGRPVLVLRKNNVVRHHNVPFQVSYSFSTLGMIQEPILLVLAFAAFFGSVMAYVRLDLSIAAKKTGSLRARRSGPLGDAVNAIIASQKQLIAIYDRKNISTIGDSVPVFDEVKKQLAVLRADAALAPIVANLELALNSLKGVAKKYANAIGLEGEEVRGRYATLVGAVADLVEQLRQA